MSHIASKPLERASRIRSIHRDTSGNAVVVFYPDDSQGQGDLRYSTFAVEHTKITLLAVGKQELPDLHLNLDSAYTARAGKRFRTDLIFGNYGNEMSAPANFYDTGRIPIRVRVTAVSSTGQQAVVFEEDVLHRGLRMEAYRGTSYDRYIVAPSKSGKYKLIFTVNPDRSILESDYDNNTFEAELTVK